MYIPEFSFSLFFLLYFDVSTKFQADSLQDVFSQLCDGEVGHGFSNINSPILQIPDNPSSSYMNQEFHIGSEPFDNDDYLNAFLNSILDSDGCSSGACIVPQESPTESLVKQAPWDSASCKDSGSNSDIEVEPCLTQVTFVIIESTTKKQILRWHSHFIFSPHNLGCYFSVASWVISRVNGFVADGRYFSTS